jgi:hypothetical protein
MTGESGAVTGSANGLCRSRSKSVHRVSRVGLFQRRRRTVLTAPGEEFFERGDWSGDQPAGWRPHEDPESSIRINPLVRFGMPAIGGISTQAIAGRTRRRSLA